MRSNGQTVSQFGKESARSVEKASVSIQKRLMPMDILTDANFNTGEVAILSDRSNRSNKEVYKTQ